MMSSSEPAPKRLKVGEQSPTSFVTWNCNGFISRCKWNNKEMEKLLRETNAPHVICLQEVRLKASSPQNRGHPLKSEKTIVKEQLDTTFKDYDKYWSLSDTRYAGTLTLIHKNLGFSGKRAFTPKAATRLLLEHYNVTRQDAGLPPEVKEPQASPKKKQSSLKSFFAPKTTSTASKNQATSCNEHNYDGRFQFFSFENMDLIQTYVPNNGRKQESHQRRIDWDQEMKHFLETRLKILSKVNKQDRPLLWCGDMNCAKDYRDGTHWERRDGSIYEWWTDESKCLPSSDKNKTVSNRTKDNIGIPGFTLAERRRFSGILSSGNLLDVWRELHPNGSSDNQEQSASPWCRPDYTWRGHLSKDGSFKSKYQGKGQRLDYFLVSPPSNLSLVESCEILGFGEMRQGLFCGSDHCATMMVTKEVLK